jgi:hypothetical protein
LIQKEIDLELLMNHSACNKRRKCRPNRGRNYENEV